MRLSLVRQTTNSALLALTLGVSLCAYPVWAQDAAKADGGKVLARVNGQPITEGEVVLAAEDLAGQYPNLPPERARSFALEFLIEVKLAAGAAKADKIDQSPDFKLKLAYAADRILMEQLLSREAAKVNGDEALKKVYDEQIKQVTPQEEVRARHILVEKEEDAKKIHARVKGGEDFAKVAAEASTDPGSGKEGGDLGFFTKDRMVPEFADAAFAMKPDEISAPVKSQFGWHIIKLEEKRTKPLPTFEQVKDQLAQSVVSKAQSEFLEKLRKDAKIEKMEAPAPITPPAAVEPKKN